jgi:hypothetical protein
MTIAEALARVTSIHVPNDAPPVVATVAAELASTTGGGVVTGDLDSGREPTPGAFHVLGIAHVDEPSRRSLERSQLDSVFLRLGPDGSGVLAATDERLLFAFVTHLVRDLANAPLGDVAGGKVFRPAFSWHRSTYDYFLNQEGRIQYRLNPETYVRRLAESGFTHIEVNGLAFPQGLEDGPPGEAYPMFYTYCPALDQFVSSALNAGLYPTDYLSANLENLKHNAELARRYGLVPGLLCFEPRSVPEAFFQRYPMLRGARVDHPFRSFKPRYNMTIAHPLVRAHYAAMVRKLMMEVPELGFLSVWTNDSGAGFEHTQSLYVGRNGGAYLVREWKDEGEIALAAGENALRYLRLLRDAGREINPDFRVMTRLESFYGEHDVMWDGLGDGIDAEAASLVQCGWDMPYAHPRYPESKALVAGSMQQLAFDSGERALSNALEAKAGHAHFYFAAGPNTMFAPLIGIPYPSLTYQRLKLLHDNGVQYLAHLGGTTPPELAPFNVNHEMLRGFQFDTATDCPTLIDGIARRWVGDAFVAALCDAWAAGEEAILAFPHVTPLYTTFGFVWYRLWARPLVPNIEAIPEAERAYYQDHMCTTPHNPNNVDLSRDVLFQLTTVEECRPALERIEAHVFPPVDRAIAALETVEARATSALGPGNAIVDQLARYRALRCWFVTQRNVAAWIVGVCGYMAAPSDVARAECRRVVDEMIGLELENSERLLELLDGDIEFMATTDGDETALIHGRNLQDLLTRRMALMTEHRHDEPWIDPEYVERHAGQQV